MIRLPRQLFVTGTGTGIGKTYVTAGLIRKARREGLSVRALKPVVSGFDGLDGSDPGVLLAAAGLNPAELDRMSPWRYAAPLSPDMAAAREGRAVPYHDLIEFCRAALAPPAEIVLIEGVGGVMVPLDRDHTVLDWMAALGLPALLVAGGYLGTISHTLTALGALERAGIVVAALVVSASVEAPPLVETAAVMARFTDVPILTLARGDDPDGLGWGGLNPAKPFSRLRPS